MTKKKIKVVVQPQKKKTKNKKEQEITAIGKALRSLGGLGGSALGGMVGQSAIGGTLGTGLGAVVSRWLGQGDYSVQSNSVVKSALRASTSIPNMHKDDQTITIRHKEFLTSIKGSQLFEVQRFFILQPGDTNTFPWASGIAARFQQYRIKGMVFHYVPTSGYAVSGTNPAIGAVMIQTSYRANDSPPASKTEMLNEYWASEASPADSFCHPIECSPKENPFSVHYVRTVPPPESDTPLMYDLGVTYIATQGMPANGNVVGDLWVTYEIELSKPLIKSNTHDTVRDGNAQVVSVNGSITPSAIFGSTTVTAKGSLPFTVTGNTIAFPKGTVGEFVVNINIFAASTFTAMNLTGEPDCFGCTLVSLGATGAMYTRTQLGGSGGTIATGHYVFQVRLDDPSVGVPYVLIPTLSWTQSAASTNILISSI